MQPEKHFPRIDTSKGLKKESIEETSIDAEYQKQLTLAALPEAGAALAYQRRVADAAVLRAVVLLARAWFSQGENRQ